MLVCKNTVNVTAAAPCSLEGELTGSEKHFLFSVFCFLFLLHFRFHCFFNFTKINLKFASIAEISIAVTCNLLNIQLSTVSLPLPSTCTPCERKRWPDRRRIGLWVVPNRQLQENNLPLAKFPHLFLEAVAPHQDKVDLGQRREIE